MGNTGNSVANVYLSNGAVMANERPDNHSTIDAAIHFSGNSKMIAPTSGTGLDNFGHFIIDNTISVTDGTENAIENGYISFRTGNGYKGGTIDVSEGAALTITSSIYNTTNYQAPITKTGAGLLVFNALNTYTQDTYVNGGTLRLDACAWNAAGWVGSIATGTNVYVDGVGSKLLLNAGDPMGNTGNSVANVYLSNGAVMANERPDNHSTIDAAIHFSGNSKMIAPTSGTGLNNFGHFIIDNTISVTDGTENAIENGYISFRNGSGYKGGTIDVSEGAELKITSSIYNTTDNQAAITKTGAGALWLSADNTYTKATTIDSGVLKLTGSLQGDVLVKSDAALILGAYTGSGSPSLKNLTLEENGTLEIALGADAYDIVGSLTMAADSGLGLALTSGLLPVDYELLSYTSSSGEGITDNIPNQVFVSLGDGKSIDISGFDMLFWNANSLYLDGAALGAAVPEPASWLTLALGLPGLVWFWRNQRRRRGVQTL